MKIEEIARFHRGYAKRFMGPEGQPTYVSQLHDNMAEALEQHQKDLMGLVEAWRQEGLDWCEVGRLKEAAMCKQHSNKLESLINTKD